MNRLKLLLIVAFLLVFGAGTVVGIVQGRTTVAPPAVEPGDDKKPDKAHRGPRDPGSWYAEALGLSSEQQQQIKEIWTEVMEVHRPQIEERRRELERTRDEALVNLLTPEQRADYDRIQSDVKQQLAQLDEDRREMFRTAQERTRALLTPEQQAKHDELMENARRQWDRGGRDGDRDGNRGDGRRRDRGGWDRDGDRADRRDIPATQPTTALAVE